MTVTLDEIAAIVAAAFAAERRRLEGVLTPKEAAAYLRLDETGTKHPLQALDYYRQQGRLRAVPIGKCIRYRRQDLEKFLDAQQEQVRD